MITRDKAEQKSNALLDLEDGCYALRGRVHDIGEVKNVSSDFVNVGKGPPGRAQTVQHLIYLVYAKTVDRVHGRPSLPRWRKEYKNAESNGSRSQGTAHIMLRA
jgi:hypothetical protein